MNYEKWLVRAGVPIDLRPVAIAALEDAKQRHKGQVLFKFKARLFKAGAIAKAIPWSAERLIDVMQEWADMDIAPMLNITGHGDNCPWEMTPEGGRPVPGRWLDADPTSYEFEQAVAANYWAKGKHPRSQKSRTAWYRRNAGEYRAWRLGEPVNPKQGVDVWRGPGVVVYRCQNAWQLIAGWKFLGIPILGRVGYEIDNLWIEERNEQAWYPIDGYELRAPVSCSVLPFQTREGL